MGQVLRLAGEKQAYTLTDRGTFLAQRKGLDLVILSEGDPLLVNRYSVILVNPARHPHVRHQPARQFADFLVSPEGQKAIAEFGKDKHGEPLFFTGEGPCRLLSRNDQSLSQNRSQAEACGLPRQTLS